ncbi:Calcineurin-like metallo-phosphoesterase superfamily protein [Rhynchospora pubera]|uniref:Calcineurin-like metallo-phosphoesterase superfamily protein n=1 Tax=Rhynchospora pubera TaxID=906938 RepID=A0AAV8E0X1_9POAL|nr:Calcineurin-like metallo-phosphoesterase superfamily protein [Rhynchospora pubera]
MKLDPTFRPLPISFLFLFLFREKTENKKERLICLGDKARPRMAAFALNFAQIHAVSRPKFVVQCCSPSQVPQINGGVVKPIPIVVSGDPPTFVSAPQRRIVAVGDLHGDLSQTRSALKMAGLLSSDGFQWTGRDTILVQVGDILDRGEHEIAILSLLKSLDVQAKSQGGAVFQVNGNHETMNIEGDFRYVDPGAFDECADFVEYLEQYNGNWDDAFLNWIFVSEVWREERASIGDNKWSPWNIVKRQKGVVARSALFSPGGVLACELSRHPVVLKVNDWIFCHGGLLPHHVKYGVERMNKEVSDWMRGSKRETDGPKMPFIALRGYDSVVWSRLYSREPNPLQHQPWKISSIAEKTLGEFKAKGMVVGHTPQTNGANSSKYDSRVWCIDVGMSSGVLNSSPEVLEIVDNKARVLKRHRDSFDELAVVDYL